MNMQVYRLITLKYSLVDWIVTAVEFCIFDCSNIDIFVFIALTEDVGDVSVDITVTIDDSNGNGDDGTSLVYPTVLYIAHRTVQT